MKNIPNYKAGFDYEQSRVCKSCGSSFKGRFCNYCGEKVQEPWERTLAHFFSEVGNALTFVDNRLLRSLWLILSNPGQLSLEVTSGRRIRYTKLVSIFFLANFIYFLLPHFQTFDSTLALQMKGQVYSEWFSIEKRVLRRLEAREIAFPDFEAEFNEKISARSKLLLIAIAPVFALFLGALTFRKRGLFSDHILFAMELLAFTLWYPVILLSYLWLLLWKLGIGGSEFYITLAVALVIAYFLFRGLRTFYKYPPLTTFFLTLVLLFTFSAIVLGYRWVVFELTFFFM